MAYELERVLRVFDGFLCSMSATYDGASTVVAVVAQTSYFCMCFLLRQESNEIILYVWLYLMTLEGARLLELHSSASVARGMSHHE